MMNYRLQSVCLWCLGLLGLFTGCVGTSMLYQGNAVAAEQVVAIPDRGRYDGSVETFEIIIDYVTVRDGDVLEIHGQAALTERYPLLYARLNYLHVYLFLVDESARVLETVRLANAMTGSVDEHLNFSRFVKLPSGATGFSLGYWGEVEEGGGDAGSDVFSRLPFSR